jgi:hypothetical protein
MDEFRTWSWMRLPKFLGNPVRRLNPKDGSKRQVAEKENQREPKPLDHYHSSLTGAMGTQ